jgi:hypothetical protein
MLSEKTARMGDKAKPLAAYPPTALLFVALGRQCEECHSDAVRRAYQTDSSEHDSITSSITLSMRHTGSSRTK